MQQLVLSLEEISLFNRLEDSLYLLVLNCYLTYLSYRKVYSDYVSVQPFPGLGPTSIEALKDSLLHQRIYRLLLKKPCHGQNQRRSHPKNTGMY